MSEGDILMATGALAAIGCFILPFAVVMMSGMEDPSPRTWHIIIPIMVFLTIPFVWRVWVLAVVN